MAYPVIGSQTTAIFNSANTRTIAIPANTLGGDLLVIFESVDINGTAVTLNTPSGGGWASAIGGQQNSYAAGTTNGVSLNVWTKVAGGTLGGATTEPSTYTATLSATRTAVLFILRIPANSYGSPILSAFNVGMSPGATRPIQSTALSIPDDETLVLTLICWDGSAGKQTAGTGYTNTTETIVSYPGNATHAQQVQQANQALAGTHASQYQNLSGAQPWGTSTLAFKEAPTPSGGSETTFKVWDGSTWIAKPVKVWDGSTWVTKPLKRRGTSTWI